MISSLLVIFLSPIYLFLQKFELGEDYKSGRFTYESLLTLYKEIKVKPLFSETSKNQRNEWVLVYGLIAATMLFFGFKLRIYAIVLSSIMALLLFNQVYTKGSGTINMVSFYVTALLVISAVFLLGQMQDEFSLRVKDNLFDNVLVFWRWKNRMGLMGYLHLRVHYQISLELFLILNVQK
jgi:hypothetical protein